jgi:hypothetical protein
MELKNYRGNHHEFRDFWWEFHDFWISGAIKINSEKIKQIKKGDQGLRFNQGFIWVQLGDRDSSGCKLGISNMHTQNQRRERGCHVSTPHWATSAWQCHMSTSHWSTPVSGPHPGMSHLTGGPHLSATWQSFNGPPHPTLWHMAASQTTTSPGICHMAAYHEATSLFEIQQLDTWQHQSEPPQ